MRWKYRAIDLLLRVMGIDDWCVRDGDRLIFSHMLLH